MAAVRTFALPDLGEGLTSAEIVRWLVAVGDVIVIDQPVAEVETAKAVVEVPCPHAGVITSLAGPAGSQLPVGAPLVTVAVSEATDEAAGAAATDEAPVSPPEGSGRPLVGYGVRDELGGFGTAAVSGAPPGRTVPKVISPLVRRLARDHAIDLTRLTGSGPDGLIRRGDVENAIAAGGSPWPPPAAPQPPPSSTTQPMPPSTAHSTAQPTAPQAAAGAITGPGGSAEPSVVALSPLARHAAETFVRSRREVADATCWVDADATALLAAKKELNQDAGPGPGAGAASTDGAIGLLAIIARICVAALLRFPDLNSQVVTDLDGRATAVRRHGAVHLGFAAQTPRGLVVPVVRDAHARSTAALAAEITRLTAAARAGRLTPADLAGGTFTLNNYGVFGVDGATPIIHHPETSMIGIGRIIPRPWVVDGALAVRSVTQLSFTFDHRVCDGATAGSFLRFVADAVEAPTRLLRFL
ncbi:dihydrolipoamide acetyltransferase family protein [Parafrankia sp. EUN1f]|uniref:dihydrolipoamide acetyltransferase family protein n=1 Tax=Parafrankia sp. EUN1f TaxID=102897 RepID=UPI00056A60A6|nr:dihydrolipoamide acetyltransferase family protein [Parafrankia sp. EUN1f]